MTHSEYSSSVVAAPGVSFHSHVVEINPVCRTPLSTLLVAATDPSKDEVNSLFFFLDSGSLDATLGFGGKRNSS
jgi:hypothetical protein